MTVKELKEKLSEFDDNLRIVTPGYEGGYNDLSENFSTSIFILDINTSWWLGSHEKKEDCCEGGRHGHKEAKALIIS